MIGNFSNRVMCCLRVIVTQKQIALSAEEILRKRHRGRPGNLQQKITARRTMHDEAARLSPLVPRKITTKTIMRGAPLVI